MCREVSTGGTSTLRVRSDRNETKLLNGLAKNKIISTIRVLTVSFAIGLTLLPSFNFCRIVFLNSMVVKGD